MAHGKQKVILIIVYNVKRPKSDGLTIGYIYLIGFEKKLSTLTKWYKFQQIVKFCYFVVAWVMGHLSYSTGILPHHGRAGQVVHL